MKKAHCTNVSRSGKKMRLKKFKVFIKILKEGRVAKGWFITYQCSARDARAMVKHFHPGWTAYRAIEIKGKI